MDGWVDLFCFLTDVIIYFSQRERSLGLDC